MKKTKVGISERALLARVNRKVGADGLQVKKSRAGTTSYSQLGDYYAIDLHFNRIDSAHIDLESWARELGVLAEYEQVAQ